ncbi:IclR family transcriptional regulator domain-containing protein [Streptomyces tropicalis]|uniref:IclR family transcriptional regulator C-terminal domain-containing protein n=1 Tax=Streptomyces tropicalis TaxID=3034234 RepID=A0ABT6A9U8_9ACTN|nr:IclR family transcriptional regulator C-terminal domain-containing protein [Streptomyces tropicalis]MDF3301418.1 IclR family transcriptional regulator C-terminal domain-containing protein [Streptomyces tropicalis]
MSAQRGTGTGYADRFMRVQQAFVPLGPGAHRLSEIAKAADLDDSTTSRILTAGTYNNTFVRVDRGLYQLGSTVADLGFHALAEDRLSGSEASEVLRGLRNATDHGLVFLYMRAPFGTAGRQCLDMAVGDSDLVELGMTPRDVLSVTRSLRTGASGRTILAYLPEEIQKRVAADPVPEEAGPGVLRDGGELLASLAEIRDQGYALGRQECMAQWNSIAAPVIWDGAIWGAVLLLKPAPVMPEAPQHYIYATITAAARLSRLGGAWHVD